MTLKVVPLRGHAPVLNDVPAMMRRVADQIDAGEIIAPSALFIVPVDGDWPMVFGWGEHLGDHGNIAICEMTKTWFINNNVARAL